MKYSEMTRSELLKHVTSIKGPAYYAPKAAPDYSPRDSRVWLRKCLHLNPGCPIERCLEMPDE